MAVFLKGTEESQCDNPVAGSVDQFIDNVHHNVKVTVGPKEHQVPIDSPIRMVEHYVHQHKKSVEKHLGLSKWFGGTFEKPFELVFHGETGIVENLMVMSEEFEADFASFEE